MKVSRSYLTLCDPTDRCTPGSSVHGILQARILARAKGQGVFIDYAKAFDCVDHNKLWKILKEMGLPDHLI